MLRKILPGTALFVLVFAGAVLVFNFILNRGARDHLMEEPRPVMNVAYMSYQGQKVNVMQGYKNELDTSFSRSEVIPLDKSKKVRVYLPADIDPKKVSYQLRDYTGANLVEDGEMKLISSDEKLALYETTIRMDVSNSREYCFVTLVGSKKDAVRYYCRVKRSDDDTLQRFIDFAKNFSNATFEGNSTAAEMAGVPKGTVTDANVASSNDAEGATPQDAASQVASDDLSKIFDTTSISRASSHPDYTGIVSLKSPYSDVIYTGLSIERSGETYVNIHELTTDTANVELDFTAVSGGDSLRTYRIREYFVLRYENSTGSITLADYHRYMDEDFTTDNVDLDTNSVRFGISSTEKPDVRASEKSEAMAFVSGGAVWYFNTDKSYLASLYGGTAKDDGSVYQQNYGIRLLTVNKKVIDFTVYGRQNEGPREGQNGVALYEYDMDTQSIRELAFIKTNLTSDILKLQAGKLSYYDNANGLFYTIVGNELLKVDTFAKTTKKVVDEISASNVYVSDDMKVIAYPNSNNPSEVKQITVMNLEKNKKITRDSTGGTLCILGMLDDSVLYGEATGNHVSVGADGLPRYMFSDLYIVDSENNLLKQYNKEGKYVTSVTLEAGMISLDRVAKATDSDAAVATTEDYITYKVQDQTAGIRTRFYADENDNSILGFRFPDDVYLSDSVDKIINKYKNNEDTVETELQGEVDDDFVYVYDAMGLANQYRSVGQAVQYASDNQGSVIDRKGTEIFSPGNVAAYRTVQNNVSYQKADSSEESLAACIYVTMGNAGLQVDYASLKSKYDWSLGSTWEQAFRDQGDDVRGINLTGADVDTAIGFLSDDIPFTAKLDGRYILVVSYNEDYIRYYDPVADKEERVARYLFTQKVTEQGGEMYAYRK